MHQRILVGFLCCGGFGVRPPSVTSIIEVLLRWCFNAVGSWVEGMYRQAYVVKVGVSAASESVKTVFVSEMQ